MSRFIDQLIEAQKHAMSIRPKVGGFPVLAEVLRKAGVQKNQWFLPSCQSIYFMGEVRIIQLGNPLFIGMQEIPTFDREKLIAALRTDQQGQSTFPEFLEAAWRAGVVSYEVDFMGRKVIYFGAHGESYLEAYPSIEVSI